jgi:hypothetical protein
MSVSGSWRYLLLAVAVLVVASVSTPVIAGARIVLGVKTFAPHGKGWGTVEPRELFNGGDASGSVTEIDWRSWGGPTAIGFGKNPIFKPGGGYYGRLATIELRAEDVGQCEGHRTYRRLSVRVPSHPGGKLGPWQLWAGASSLCGYV